MSKYDLNSQLAWLENFSGKERSDFDLIKPFKQPVLCSNGIPVFPGYAALYIAKQHTWNCALNWFYKKQFNHKHKVPYGNNTKGSLTQATEPLGELLRSTFALCIECHQYPSKYSEVYERGTEWFAYVAREITEFSFHAPNGKTEAVERIRGYSKQLKSVPYENSFDPQSQPHLYGLIQVAFKLARLPQYPGFEKHYLRRRDHKKREYGWIFALSAWSTELQKNPQFSRHIATPEKLQWQAEQGHHRKTLDRNAISRRLE